MYVQVFAHGNRALKLIIKAPQSSRGEGEGLKGGGGGGGGTVKATPPPPPPLLCSIHSLPHPPHQTLLMPYRWGAAAQIPNQQPEP